MRWEKLSDSPCRLCPRECGSLRQEGQKGYCGADNRIIAARAALHRWEEPCISGDKGSGTVFFSGCSLKCIYCQNYDIAHGEKGKEVTVSELSSLFLSLQEQGAANINLVTPDSYVIPIARAVEEARREGLFLPIVYNGSGYEKSEVIRALSGIVDIYLTDFKYMDSQLASRFSHAPDYPEVAAKALAAMVECVGEPVFDEKGMMRRGVLVRHLVLPGHKKNARAVIRYLRETYGEKVYLSLMNQYTPMAQVRDREEFRELGRKVTKREYEAVVEYALSLGVNNAYIQEGDTAKESFVPAWDME